MTLVDIALWHGPDFLNRLEGTLVDELEKVGEDPHGDFWVWAFQCGARLRKEALLHEIELVREEQETAA